MTQPSSFPARAQVDLDAIAGNVRRLAEFAPSSQVMAVVKGDAYGHGLVPSARAAQAGGASWLGVAQLEEAIALREAGVQGRVLTWMFAPGQIWNEPSRSTSTFPSVRRGRSMRCSPRLAPPAAGHGFTSRWTPVWGVAASSWSPIPARCTTP